MNKSIRYLIPLALMAAAAEVGVSVTAIGRVVEGGGVAARVDGFAVTPARAGWRHV